MRTQDMVQAELHVKHRVRFEGDPDRWFAVENYVQLLCDHTRSLIAEQVRRVTVQALRQDAARLVREAVLGPREGAERPGRAFDDNGMRIVDVEVLEVRLGDQAVDEMLAEAQLEAIRAATQVAVQEANLAHQTRIDEIDRALAAERAETERVKLELLATQEAQAHAQARRRQTSKAELAAVEGRGLLETARKYLDFVPARVLPVLGATADEDPSGG